MFLRIEISPSGEVSVLFSLMGSVCIACPGEDLSDDTADKSQMSLPIRFFFAVFLLLGFPTFFRAGDLGQWSGGHS